jgi:nitrate/nitrite transporter NarK
MTVYMALRLVHVVVAVLGTGSIAAIAIVARRARAQPAGLLAGPLLALARWASISLAVMLLTGIWIDIELHGAYHQMRWFRGSVIGLVLTGATLGLLRRQIAGALSDRLAPERALARVTALAVVASALVLAIVVLMERRPA